MAQETIIRKIDDIDGSEGDVDTLTFAVHGKTYEIDLSKANVQRFEEVFAPYVEKARRAQLHSTGGNRAATRGSGSTAESRQQSQELRAWAKQHGIAVSDRGRVSELVKMLHQATGGGAPTDEQITQFGVQRA